MDLVILIGRILFALVFVGGAVGHFSNASGMSAYTESMGLRPGRLFVLGSGLWTLIAGIMIILGVWMDLAALMLAIFLVLAAVLIHRFWSVPDADAKMNEQVHFNKNLSLAGGALILFGFVVSAGDGLGYSLTGPLFG
ncbi:DoxX family protein [Mycolicibacterium thermoresistibile]|uniref:DoxX family protein n=2 Tax=Mycolicibacterium thermoresistibile TaxID=1797 RepID=G7CNN4_MYCT3|nr:DoxX family protein [Mycolicibacterium thermoresistibile]EHI10438.1 DoxX family protein [Mycolicibacterium thermoresistibile ATCC 19527]MCV7187632.1 DoxX family protein [Mycolicibacterium thermoresistibile]GAT13629.1 DoxX family protein [Mycolicibacterium thermoresistibile]SNW17270.1 DoxX [Mycolicibacterium thermoresistibile]